MTPLSLWRKGVGEDQSNVCFSSLLIAFSIKKKPENRLLK
jgi:hypothetical protein